MSLGHVAGRGGEHLCCLVWGELTRLFWGRNPFPPPSFINCFPMLMKVRFLFFFFFPDPADIRQNNLSPPAKGQAGSVRTRIYYFSTMRKKEGEEGHATAIACFRRCPQPHSAHHRNLLREGDALSDVFWKAS